MIYGIERCEPRKPSRFARTAQDVLYLLGVLLTMLVFAAFFALDDAHSAELYAQAGDANWSRCSGSACWDESGDPTHPLPVAWNTRGTMLSLGGRAGEVELRWNAASMRGAVRGTFVDDQFFDAQSRRVLGHPTRHIEAQVDQWQTGLRAVWAPRWQMVPGVAVQPEIGAYWHHTRWAITWTKPDCVRGDGGDRSVTPTGGVRLLVDAHDRLAVAVGLEAYHRPTVQTAPLGGGGRRGPGLVVTAVELRWSL